MRLLSMLFKRWATYRLSKAANLRDIQRWMLRKHARRTALVVGATTLRFEQLEQQVQSWAQAFHNAGLRVGDGILVIIDDPLYSVIVRFAGVEAGLVQLSLRPDQPIDFVCACARRAAPKLALLDCRLADTLGCSLQADLPELIVWPFSAGGELTQRIAQSPAVPIGEKVPLETPVSLGFTSGTTGQPKMLQLQQQQMLASIRLMLLNIDDVGKRDASMLIAVPLHGAGGGVLMPVLLAGGSAIVPIRHDVAELVHVLRQQRPSRVFVTPSQLIDLLDCDALQDSDMRSVEQLIYGSAPLAVARIREAITRFGPILQQGYGMSEALPPVAMLPPSAHVDDANQVFDSALSSVGKVARGVAVEVRSERGEIVAVGETGRIWVKTPTVFSGYVDQPSMNAQVFDSHGFYFTGDMGYFDSRQRLHVLDRLQDVIPRAGLVVYPRQVEEYVHECVGVKEAVLVAVEEVLHLVVSARTHPPAPPSAVLVQRVGDHLRTCLPAYAIPQQIHVWQDLPRSALGKVLRRDVRAALQERGSAA